MSYLSSHLSPSSSPSPTPTLPTHPQHSSKLKSVSPHLDRSPNSLPNDLLTFEKGLGEPDLLARPFDPLAAADDEDEQLEFPDGKGRSWFVVVGAFHMTFATFGLTNGYGVFQAYYETDLLSSWDSSSIAWIGSLQYCLIFLPALVMGRLLDRGVFLVPYTVAAVLYTLSVVLTAECTQYWHFLLCQGVLGGLAAGMMFGPVLALVSHWFLKKRAKAYGIVACGSSVGGTIFPIMVRKLIPILGFKWTLRACALIIFYCVAVGWFTLRPRLKPKQVSDGLFNFAAFRSPTYSFYVLGCCFVITGIYTPITYLVVDGERAGLGDFSSYLVAIVNAFTIVGRLAPGYFADRVGPVNLLIPFSAISGILIFAWPFCVSRTSLIIFSALMGIASGAFVSLYSPGAAQLGESHDLGRRLGMLTTCLSAASLIGPPISGAILSATSDFLKVAAFAGTIVLIGAATMLASRFYFLRTWWGKM